MSARLSLALESGAVSLPDTGEILLCRPPGDLDLSALPLGRLRAHHGFRPDHDALAMRGVQMLDAMPAQAAAAVVFATRAKALTHDLLARAMGAVGSGGTIIVDGAKGDGIDSLLKRLRKIGAVGEVFAKAHGKCFALEAPTTPPEGWAAQPAMVDGFQTMAGVFSADGIDPGSALLAPLLGDLSGRVCDLGAGWGYLGAQILASDKVTELALVEAERAALDCARINLPDPRVRFHWADATGWSDGTFDAVVMNPPFHTGRRADPALGQAFVRTAAWLLTSRGRLLMVANRHLPYEATLRDGFSNVMVRADTGGYKVLEATGPQRRKP